MSLEKGSHAGWTSPLWHACVSSASGLQWKAGTAKDKNWKDIQGYVVRIDTTQWEEEKGEHFIDLSSWEAIKAFFGRPEEHSPYIRQRWHRVRRAMHVGEVIIKWRGHIN